MDEFGVLTERFGLKPQGKSAPMAASKLSNHINSSNSSLSSKSFPNSSKSDYNSNSFGGSFSDDFFGGQKSQSFVGGDDGFDIFGGFPSNLGQTSKNKNGPSDFGSVFSNSNFSSAKSSFDGDILGGLTSSNSSSADDIFGSYPQTKQTAPIDDLFGNFSAKPSVPRQNGSSVGFDDLIPGFGSSNSSKKGDVTGIKQSVFTSIGDPFVVLESTSTSVKSTFTDPLDTFSQFNHSGSKKPAGASNVLSALRPPPRPGQVLKSEKVRSSDESSIDELEEFAMGKVRQTAKGNKFKEAEDASRKNKSNSADDLESFFSMGSRSSSVPKSRATPSDPLFDTKINNRRDPVVPQKNSSSGMRKASSTTTMPDDLFSMFGDISPMGEFEEVEGESEERRKARLDRHHRTKDRVAQAVAEMNQRDLKSQHEQEERRRIAETMDAHIKRWAAGKEGNMRALLSSLQYVLWSESGWEPVSLTDLITSSSVKKVYRRATLCVHPDKVQQKGSTLEQKYTAEKVFDILKEAWTKFNKEELS